MIARPGYRRSDIELIVGLCRATGLEPDVAELGELLPLSETAYATMRALDAPPGTEARRRTAPRARVPGHGSPRGAMLAELDRLVELGLVAEEGGENERRFRLTGLGEVVMSIESGRRRRRFDFPTMPTFSALTRSRGHARS